ncbi:MAG: hypothetical protein HON98_12945 [Chloroflexi bacterium]|nr:hypothetical protein [Chloroflexota bacterium]MBT4003333.1 hypothetical protein [Chloroflexota bacterium]MBT4305865.1 hypothetical protein [Chloroflexota bacterium]MBT4533690.1 hypothetical protein [Chloroflexota bacterium]MBT4681667.1 hypothetical protein [Chloroflexota bacterium]
MKDLEKKEVTNEVFCEHAAQNIRLKTSYVFPPDIFPDTLPRINKRSCSHVLDCNLMDKDSCEYLLKSQ